MSCGNHHDTPCSDVLDAVSAYLDGECEEHASQHIATHFEECAPCLKEYGIYQEVKLLVARSCGCDPVPDEVRARVVSRIRAVAVTWHTDDLASAGSASMVVSASQTTVETVAFEE
jgi:mycothiol system anti-sigma-R factor